jgi:transcription antitermination factor NusG
VVTSAESGAPIPVPDEMVDAIKSRERDGALELPKRKLKPGDRVRIVAGFLAGHRGQLFEGNAPARRGVSADPRQ